MKDWTTGTVSFKEPAGWSYLSCKPAQYPDFTGESCHCLGDAHISAEQALQILEDVCVYVGQAERTLAASMVVPFKHRCGVKSLSNITIENRCRCEEKNDKGVGKSILKHSTGISVKSIWLPIQISPSGM